MRLYTFTHYMLSPIAKGIQSGHATTELFVKYKSHNYLDIVYNWAKNFKTHISLNGGTSPDLSYIIQTLDDICEYPWAYFNEDESLGNLTTSVSLVVPEEIYITAEYLRNGKLVRIDNGFDVQVDSESELFEIRQILDNFILSNNDIQLIEFINNYRLIGV